MWSFAVCRFRRTYPVIIRDVDELLQIHLVVSPRPSIWIRAVLSTFFLFSD